MDTAANSNQTGMIIQGTRALRIAVPSLVRGTPQVCTAELSADQHYTILLLSNMDSHEGGKLDEQRTRPTAETKAASAADASEGEVALSPSCAAPA